MVPSSPPFFPSSPVSSLTHAAAPHAMPEDPSQSGQPRATAGPRRCDRQRDAVTVQLPKSARRWTAGPWFNPDTTSHGDCPDRQLGGVLEGGAAQSGVIVAEPEWVPVRQLVTISRWSPFHSPRASWIFTGNWGTWEWALSDLNLRPRDYEYVHSSRLQPAARWRRSSRDRTLLRSHARRGANEDQFPSAGDLVRRCR